MPWADLTWLAEHGYVKVEDPTQPWPEKWVRKGRSTRRSRDFWTELVVRWTGDAEGKDYVELSSFKIDDHGQSIFAAIDEIAFDDLRARLGYYEQRVLQMLRVGLDSASSDPTA